MPRSLVSAAAIIALFVLVASAQTTWTGAISSQWSLGANWTAGAPTATVDATIPGVGITNFPSTASSAGAVCRALTVQSGGTLTLAAGFPLECRGNVSSAGTVTGADVIRITAASTISTTGGGSFGSIVVDSGASVVNGATAVLSGSFTILSGSFSGSGTFNVQGAATFSGGTLVNGGGTVDIDGAVTMAGATASNPTAMRVGGNWTVTAAGFSPTSSIVTFDGASPQTIAGSPLSFNNVTVQSGSTVTSNATTALNGTLTVDGNMTFMADASANSSVALGASGQVAFGANTLTVGASFTGSGNITATGVVRFVGASSTTFSVAAALPNVEIMKTGSASFAASGNTAVNGTLLLAGGSFSVAGTMVVGGAATMSGGNIVNGGGTLDLNGSATWSGTTATAPSAIRCAGNWTVAAPGFAPTSNTVTLDGVGPRTVSGTPVVFNNLALAAGSSVSVSTSLTCNGSVTLDGALTTAAGAAITSSVTINASGSMAIGTTTVSIGGSLTGSGGFSGTGLVVFNGNSFSSYSLAAPLPSIEIAKGANVSLSASSMTNVNGNLTLTSGVLSFGGTLNVQGNALLQGGSLVNGGGVMDVDGNITLAGTTTTSSFGTIRCAGNWTVTAPGFAPTNGTVNFDGASPQSISGSPVVFAIVQVASSANVTSSVAVTTTSSATINGSLAMNGALSIGSSLTLAAGGSLSMGSNVLTVSSNATLTGSFSSSSSVVLDGSGSASVSSSSPLPSVTVSKTGFGSVFFSGGLTIVGNLQLTGGSLSSSGTTNVTADALLSGGSLTNGGGTLDVDGNVVLSGTTGTSIGAVRCAGDWTGHGAFAPTSGTVTLDAVGSRQILGPIAGFPGLTIAAGANISTSTTMDVAGALIVNGTMTSTAGTTFHVGGATTVSGSLATAGTYDFDGSVTVNSGATVAAGNGTHRFGASLNVNGSLSATGLFVFDGNTSASISSVSALPAVRLEKLASSGVGTTGALAVNGDLIQISGSFSVSGTTTVTGDVTLAGGTFTNGGGTLDVDGDVTLSGTAATAPSSVRCAGNWTGHPAFAPSSGTVTFDGTGVQTVIGTGVSFANLVVDPASNTGVSVSIAINGSLTVSGVLAVTAPITSLHVAGSCTVSGSLSTLGTLDIDGTTNIQAAGTLMAGNGTHFFGSSFTCTGAINAQGLWVFDGNTSASVISTPPLPAVRVDKSSTASTSFTGPLTMNGGFELASGFSSVSGIVAVNGSAMFSGGTFTNAGGTMDVSNDVAWAGTIATNPSGLRCGGNWTGHAGFAPNSGLVTFDGTANQVLSGPLSFASMTVAPGATAQVTAAIAVQTALVVDGTMNVTAPLATLAIAGSCTVSGMLTTGAAVDIDGIVTVNAAGVLSAGSGTHRFGASLTVTGSLNAMGTFIFDGGTSSTVSSASALPTVRVEKNVGAPLVLAAPTVVNGTLTQVTGTMSVSGVVPVGGTATFSGGVFTNAGGTLDVAGDVTFAGTSAVTPSSIRCAGNFTADAAFAPIVSSVELDGASPTTFASSSGSMIHFASLIVRNGLRSPATNLTVTANSLTIDMGGTLSLGARRLALRGTTVAVSATGLLAIDAGGELALDAACALTVNSNGTLAVIGAPGNAARVTGENGGGYSFVVNGIIAARDYEFRRMGTNGIVINNAAVIAPSPFNIRHGVFDEPSPNAGSRLLDLRRPQPYELRHVAFQNSNGFGANNVRVNGGAAITITNWSGTFAGPAFESDPVNLITWGPNTGTELSSFVLASCPAAVVASWSTVEELGVASFTLERSLAATGPWTAVGTLPAHGPGAYALRDGGLTGGTTYFYRLSETTSAPATNVLALNSVVPGAAIVPANVLEVGPGGTFADIQSAVAAAIDPGTVIRVAAGTYPAFTVTASMPPSMRIVGADVGATIIDTSGGPLTISGLTPGQNLEITGLVIGSPATNQRGLVVTGSAGTVLVNECAVTGGVMQPGVDITGSSFVHVQRSSVSGTPGMRVRTSSIAALAASTVDEIEVLSSSRLFASGNTVTTTTTAPGATLTAYAGVMPDLTAPREAFCALPFDVTLQAQPFQFWILAASITLQWFDLTTSAIDMIGLVEPSSGAILLDATGFTGPTGADGRTFTVPNFPALYGRTLTFEAVTFDILTGRYRWSTAAPVLFLP